MEAKQRKLNIRITSNPKGLKYADLAVFSINLKGMFMGQNEAEFIIYMINEVANRNNIYPSQVYKMMDRTGCIWDYLVPYYDILHSMSSESVAKDIMEYIKQRSDVL